MPSRNYYQPNKEKLKEQAKILISLLRKNKRVNGIIEIGIIISMKIKRTK